MNARIKLKGWLMMKGKRQGELAKEIGVGENTVSTWIAGKAKPNRESAYRVERLTDGYVTANDWSEE